MWQFWKPKKSPEHDLQQLVESLRNTVAGHMKSIVLFGSLASEEFRSEHSDVNVLIVLDDVHLSTLRALGSALKDWLRKGHIPPVFLEQNEVASFARSFPIEFLDMQDHHRVLYGEDPLVGLTVDTAHLRSQCQHELSTHLLKLRQALVAAGGDTVKVRSLLIDSLPSVLTLFRAILRLEGPISKFKKIEAAERLAEKAGFDPACLRRINDLHLHRHTDNLDDLANDYLQIIDKVLHAA